MRKPSIFYCLGSLLFSLIVACVVEKRIFSDPFALNDDVRNQVYWMARLLEPTLFQNDYIAAYFTQPLLVSPVLSGLYAWMSHWLHPLVFSQFLPLALVLLATFFLFQYAARYLNAQYAAWVCFAFNSSIWIFKNLAGGLSRAFFYPLFFLFLWMLEARQWKWVVSTIWLCALVYPPTFFLTLGLLGLEIWFSRRDKAECLLRAQCFLAALAGGLSVVAWRTFCFPKSPQAFGPLTTAGVAESVRDFYAGGRVVLFPFSFHPTHGGLLLEPVLDVLERLPHLYILIPTALFLMGLALYQRFGRKHWGDLLIPKRLWHTLIASCILYCIAWLVLFYLYVPERYLQYTLPLIPTFLLGGILYQLQQHYKGRAVTALLITTCLLVTCFFWRSDLLRPSAPERALYTYLKTLPKQALIAASPAVASNIPLYSFRSVLISNEAYIPFHQGYFKQMKQRLYDWLRAYYTVEPAPLLSLLRTYPIQYLVIQHADFTPSHLNKLEKRSYYAFDHRFFQGLIHPKTLSKTSSSSRTSTHSIAQPDSMQTQARASSTPPETSDAPRYLLERLPKDCIVFANEKFQVIDARRLAQHLSP